MKKFIFILAIVVIAIMFFGCKSDGNLMPTLEELKNTSSKEEYNKKVKEIGKIIDETSYEDVCSDIEKTFNEWIEKQDLIELEGSSIEFTKDETLMNQMMNERMYANIFVEIKLNYDPEKIKGNEREITDKVSIQLSESMNNNMHVRFKVIDLCIGFYSNKGVNRYGCDGVNLDYGRGMSPQPLVPKMSESEKATQTIVYDFVKDWNNEKFGNVDSPNAIGLILLKNFGLISEDKALYICVGIDIDYPDKSSDETLKDIEDKSLEIKDLILKSQNGKDFLKENEIKKIKFSFYTPWVKENYQNYEYDV
ncbi:MAG: hypothetical protein CSB16_01715 [Clostridiales bacterium]|nr:MAG: hypothetical protein CSB16_01715 [Clostridiales bacterium]